MSNESILHRIEEQGRQAPRVDLKGTTRNPQATERYEILGEIARGGVGLVHRGRDNDLGRDVALKVLLDQHLETPELVQRFVEEAQIGGQLQHPGIVPVYELGLRSDARPYFAMKLVKGETLAARLAKGTDGRRALLAVFRDVCRTMAYAHARSVIHRDLKPSNIMIGNFGEVQVVDWGFAKVLRHGGVADERLAKKAERDITMISTVRSGSSSVAGSVLGTPAYMPPEQALGRVDDLDERSDLFSLGAILCEILTGKPPYTGPTRMEDAAQALLEPALKRLDESGADDRLKKLCRQLLQPLPKDRPATAEMVADEVAAYLTTAEGRAHRAQVRALKAERRVAEQSRARRMTTLVGTSAVAALVIAAAAVFWMDAERTGRDRERRAAIDAAVEDALQLRVAKDWPAAVAAVQRAADLGYDGPLADTIRHEAADAAAVAQRRAEERALLAALEVARGLDPGHHTSKFIDGSYVNALKNVWPTMEVDTERLRASPYAEQFAAAFDRWTRYRRLKDRDWRVPDGLARAVDPDHNEIRDAIAKEDLEALKRFTQRDDLSVVMQTTIGDVLTRPGHDEAAVALMRRAFRQHPGDYWLHAYLAYAERWVGDEEAELRHRLAALAIRPDSMHARHRLGQLCDRKGDHEGALKWWRDGLRVNPEWSHGIWHMARTLRRMDRIDDALKVLDEGIGRMPDRAELLFQRGQYWRDYKNRFDDALSDFERVIELDPEDPRGWDAKGETLWRKGDSAAAEAAIREALRLDPEDDAAGVRLGKVLWHQGKAEEAEKAHRDAIKMHPKSARAYSALAGMLRLQGRIPDAYKEIRKAVTLNPRSGQAQSLLGLLMSDLNSARRPPDPKAWDEAIAKCRLGTKLQPQFADVHANLANACIQAGRTKDALDALREAIRLEPRSVHYPYLRCVALVRGGRYEEAIAACRKLFERAPRYAPTWVALARALARTGDFDGALDAWRTVAKLNPRQQFMPGVFLCDHYRDYDAAIEEFQAILEEQPNNPSFHLKLGSAFKNKHDLESAIRAYRAAVDLLPRGANLHYNLADALEQSGRLEDAAKCYRKALEVSPQDRNARYGVEWIEATIAAGERLDESDGFTPEECAFAGNWLFVKKRYAESVRMFQRAFAGDPTLAQPPRYFLYRSIRAAGLAGDQKRGVKWCRQYLEWLRATGNRMNIESTLRMWKADTDLAGIRDDDAFWKEVDAEIAK